MPILSASKKAFRQTKTRTIRNESIKKKYKEILKDFEKALKEGVEDRATELLSKLYKALDLMGKKNVFHKNKSSRLKSRLAKQLSVTFKKEEK